jgi:hypothetical protein
MIIIIIININMKKINNNFQCSNVITETYTKKEQSPKGLGLSAVGYEINHELTGVDNEIWIVQYKNGKKVWFRKSGMPKITHEETLIDDNNKVKEITEEKQILEVNTTEKNQIKNTQDKKITDYNYFYQYYSNKLKTENDKKDKANKKKPKEIQSDIFEEWNRLKQNKTELEELLKVIKNK